MLILIAPKDTPAPKRVEDLLILNPATGDYTLDPAWTEVGYATEVTIRTEDD